MFAAAYGYSLDSRVPFEATDEAIPWNSFEDYEPLINLLAMAFVGEIAILDRARFGEQLTIFEEFANGGLEQMAKDLKEAHGDQAKACFMAMVKAASSKTTDRNSGEGSISDILSALLK